MFWLYSTLISVDKHANIGADSGGALGLEHPWQKLGGAEQIEISLSFAVFFVKMPGFCALQLLSS